MGRRGRDVTHTHTPGLMSQKEEEYYNPTQHMWTRVWSKGKLSALLVEMQIVALATENNMEVSQKIKTRTTI